MPKPPADEPATRHNRTRDDKNPPAPERYNELRVPGATFRTTINERTYLTFGVPRNPFVLIEGTSVLMPVSHPVDNVVTIAGQVVRSLPRRIGDDGGDAGGYRGRV